MSKQNFPQFPNNQINNDQSNRSNNQFLNSTNKNNNQPSNSYSKDISGISNVIDNSSNNIFNKESGKNLELEKMNVKNFGGDNISQIDLKSKIDINNTQLYTNNYSQVNNNNTYVPNNNLKNNQMSNNIPNNKPDNTPSNNNPNNQINYSPDINNADNPHPQHNIGLSSEEIELDRLVAKKNRKISLCYYIFHFAVLILFIPITSFVILARSKLSYSEVNYFSEIGYNWISSPIINLSATCIGGNYDYFINDYWGGTNTGCSCGSLVSIGSCPKRSYGCSSISPYEPIRFNFWRGTRICVERMGKTYLDLELVNSPDKCPANMRSCGMIDSQNNYLCLESSKLCPFNQITSGSSDSKGDLNDIVLKLNSTNIIFSRESVNTNILFYFKVSFDQPCKNPYFENLNFPVYVLNFFYGKQYCYSYSDYSDTNTVMFDANFKLVDNYNGDSLYSENGISKILSGLPSYNTAEYKRPINLYGKNYFGLKYECFKRIKNELYIEDILNDFAKINLIEDSSSKSVISLLFNFISIFMMFIYICCFRCVIPQRRGIRPVQINHGNLYFYIMVFLVSLIAHFVFILINYNVTSNLKFSQYSHEIFQAKMMFLE